MPTGTFYSHWVSREKPKFFKKALELLRLYFFEKNLGVSRFFSGQKRASQICVIPLGNSTLKKKTLRFPSWSFIIILQFFLLIIMAVWNIKQTIMKDYNIQSCQWMVCDCFRQPFLLCTTFRSFLCTVHYFLCAFSAKNEQGLARKRKRMNKVGEGIKTRESWVNVLFKFPLTILAVKAPS